MTEETNGTDISPEASDERLHNISLPFEVKLYAKLFSLEKILAHRWLSLYEIIGMCGANDGRRTAAYKIFDRLKKRKVIIPNVSEQTDEPTKYKVNFELLDQLLFASSPLRFALIRAKKYAILDPADGMDYYPIEKITP